MEVLIVILLTAVLCCIVILSVEVKNQRSDVSENQYRLLMKEQESRTQKEEMQHQFQNVIDQMQTMRKEQAASYQAMNQIQNHMEMMNRVMTNTKARGNWGEYQLDFLLKMYAGSNPNIYTTQYILRNGKIADAVLFLPNTDKVLCIDSKFPMENYIKKEDKAFTSNMKKHINDIADKYINQETLNYAILFLPSEAVYQYICASQSEILNYALEKHVFLTSPTTLIGIVFTLISSTKDFYQVNHIEEIENNILLLQEDMERLCMRTEKAEKTLDTLHKQFHEVSVSAHKVTTRMDNMTKGKEDYD